MQKCHIQVEVVCKVTYSESCEFPTIEDAQRYVDVMLSKKHYINWENCDIEELGHRNGQAFLVQ